MTRPGSPGTAADRFRVDPPTVPAPREHADPAEPGRRIAGRHRAPPPVPTPRAPTVIAVAAAVLTAASLTAIAGQAVAPDGRVAASHVSTVTRAERTTAGPLEIPTVGVVAPAIESLYPTPSAAPGSTPRERGVTRTPETALQALQGALVAITDPSEPTVTPAPQPVIEKPAPTTRQRRHRTAATPTTPLADPIAADTSATSTEEMTVDAPTETSVTVDVTAGATP